jgi:hypothetical protein
MAEKWQKKVQNRRALNGAAGVKSWFEVVIGCVLVVGGRFEPRSD